MSRVTSFKRFVSIAVLAFAIVTLATPSAIAQVGATTGAIIGTVTDNTKAVIPGVTITVSGPALMGVRTVVTAEDGAFRLPALPPGVYQLVFELPGFATITREGIQIGLGFTATINTEMNPATVQENVTVSGASPVVDLASTKVATNYGAEKLGNLGGSRDYAAVTAFLPATSMSRPSVGGTGAVTYQRSIRYGMRGHDRGEVEGIVTTEAAAGGQEVAYSDSDSFEDMALNVVGNGADMPNPGTLTKVISKSGGNTYRGRVYLDYQSDDFAAHNMDAEQTARLTKVGTTALEDSNRLVTFRDFSGDMGGYIFKNKLWWYAAYRRQYVALNELNLIDDVHKLELHVRTMKYDYSPKSNQKFTWYWFQGHKHQNGAILGNLDNTALVRLADLQKQKWPNGTWKLEYDSVIGSSAVVEVRGGNFFERGIYDGMGDEERYQDTGANRNIGNAGWSRSNHHRPQVNGSLTYFKDNLVGSHNFKFGGEVMNELDWGTAGAFNQRLLILNNGVPTQVRLYDPPVVTGKRGVWLYAGYVQDTWRLNSRLTFNLGVRFEDQHSYVPEQTGVNGQQFAKQEAAFWKSVGPRFGIVYDLTGDGKTVLKGNYGKYWEYPYGTIASTMNPVPSQSSRLYNWTPTNPRIVNGLPVYDPGQEGLLVSITGARADGRPATLVDPNLENGYSHQALVYAEREVMPDFGVRTGFVWNGQRQGRATVNLNQPFAAFNVPVSIADPGPDGRAGTADDGPNVTAYNLDPAYIGRTPDQFLTNIPYTDNDYYTWEVMASKRQSNNWGLQASFARTWHSEGVAALTPNQLINTDDGRNTFTSWAAKLQAPVDVRWGLRVTPMLRLQTGQAYARTFQARLNYNTAVVINAETVGARRTDKIGLFDIRTEKTLKINRSTIGLFFDVYNILNSNAVQELTRTSGAAFERPSVITAPRVARFGLKFNY